MNVSPVCPKYSEHPGMGIAHVQYGPGGDKWEEIVYECGCTVHPKIPMTRERAIDHILNLVKAIDSYIREYEEGTVDESARDEITAENMAEVREALKALGVTDGELPPS
jgi:hypothetical protein